MENWARGALRKCLGSTVSCPLGWEGDIPSLGTGSYPLLLGKVMTNNVLQPDESL